MLIVSVVLFLLLLAIVLVFLTRRMLRVRRLVTDAYRTGMAEGAAQPGAETQPRGAGGLTAAQTTAMANNFLKAYGGTKGPTPANSELGDPPSAPPKP